MICLIGGSASGKSTVEKILCNEYGFTKLTSYTTRQPRDGEINGVDYHFISDEEFIKKEKEGFFAEHAVYNGWRYGSAVEDCTDDKVAVLTPHGFRQLKKNPNLNIVSFYFDVPRRDRLVKILQRGDNIEEAKRRDASDVGQFDGCEDEVDYTLENPGYEIRPEFMAKKVYFMYTSHLNNFKTNKNKEKLTILCDIDEVVNDLIEKILVKYNEKYDDNVVLDDITSFDIEPFLKEECEDIFGEFCNDEFLETLELQPKAKEVIDKLMNKHNFYFLTSTYPRNVNVKHLWLSRFFPEYSQKNLIVCMDKNLVPGDVLIDDNLGNLSNSVEHNLIFDKPWNRQHGNFDFKTIRVNSWEEIDKFISSLEEDTNGCN